MWQLRPRHQGCRQTEVGKSGSEFCALSDNLRPVGAVRKVKFNYYT
jgi:hypothetical protein